MSKSKKTKIIAGIVLVLLVIAAIVIVKVASPKAVDGSKAIVFEVTHSDGTVVDFDISTDSENLRGALEQENLITGTESSYGLYVTEIDGETADDSLRQWWCFTKDGEMLNTGVDDTMIADGEHYEAFMDTY
jgi:hypothetical protein